MDLTHCKHNVPMEVECMACESDEMNNAGGGIPASGYEARLERQVVELQADLTQARHALATMEQEFQRTQQQAQRWRAATMALAALIRPEGWLS